MIEDEDVRRIVQAFRAVLNADASITGTISDRWAGGQVIFKPGKTDTQDKVVAIDNVFKKIVSVRERLRVLEQRINAHPKLDDTDRLQLQEYISRAYGSLTTFNFLFADPDDHFASSKDSEDA